MPAREISFQKGSIYHFQNRGAGRHNIFIRPADYHYVTFKLEEYLKKLELSMIAYSLLPNHYHLLVRQDGQMEAGELPKRLFGGYSRAMFNRFGWSGTLFPETNPHSLIRQRLSHTDPRRSSGR